MPWTDDLSVEQADSLSEEVKTNPTLIQYKTLEDMLQGHIKTKSLVGSSIRIPGEDAPEEDRTKFLEQLITKAPGLMMKPDFSEKEQATEFYSLFGKPSDATQYQLPEGAKLTVDVESEIREIAFNANLNQEQFGTLASEMDSRNQQLMEGITTKTGEAMEGLKGEWGMTFDDRTKAAQKMNEQFYPGRDFANITPAERKALFAISESMTGKPSPLAGSGEGQPMAITPTEARERADEIMRRVHDPKSELTQPEKMALINKRIHLLQTYVPEFAKSA